MDINVRKHQEVQVVQLIGDLRLGAPVDSFRETIHDLLQSGSSRIVVNLASVPMIDSSGIGALVRALTTAKQNGGALKLVNPSKFALQTLKIVGLLNLFEIFGDDAEAVSSY